MKSVLPGIVVTGVVEGKDYDETLQLHKENSVNEKINQRYAIDEALIENGYRNGTTRTQHGVNAEHIYVADYNIKETRLAAEQHRNPFYIEKSSEVNGPHDLIRGGEIYQMKYYKTAKGSLDACIEHIDKYPKDYQNNEEAYYVIPKDQYQTIISIKNGEIPDGVSTRSANAIKKSIALFESKKGGQIEDTLLPGSVSYQDAFVGHNQEGNSDRRLSIDQSHREAEEQIVQSHQPHLLEGIQTSITAATIGAVVSVVIDRCRSTPTTKSVWKIIKNAVGTFISTGVVAGVIYSISAFTPVSVILISTFVIVVKESIVVVLKHRKEKKTLFDTVASFSRGVDEIIISCSVIAAGYMGISELMSKLIAKGYSVHFMIIIIFGVAFSILSRVMVSKCFQFFARALNKKTDEKVDKANRSIEKDSVETEYHISLLLEEEAAIREYSRIITNRRYGLERRLSAITEVNKIIFTSKVPR